MAAARPLSGDAGGGGSSAEICDSDWRDFDSCPGCARPVYYSQLEAEGTSLSLKCSPCKHQYELPSTASQRRRLSRQPGHPIFAQPITLPEDIAPGDVIGYYRVVTVRQHRHFAVVLGVSRTTRKVTVIEFVPHFPLRWGRVAKCDRDLTDDIINRGGWVLRYMPMDCSPIPDVIRRAKDFLSTLPPLQFDWSHDAQHLVSWCKTLTQTDLLALLPQSFYDTLFSHQQLILEHPAVHNTEIQVAGQPKETGRWKRPPAGVCGPSGRLLKKCPGKTCGANFRHSALIMAQEFVLKLKCGECGMVYFVENSEPQREELRSQYGKFLKEEVTAITDLRVGDILIVDMTLFEHHAVVTEVDRKSNAFTVVEYGGKVSAKAFSAEKNEVKRESKDLDEEMKSHNLYVQRYLPLDCQPRDDVIQKAEEALRAQPMYSLGSFNCHHLSSFCKTRKVKELPKEALLNGASGVKRRLLERFFSSSNASTDTQ